MNSIEVCKANIERHPLSRCNIFSFDSFNDFRQHIVLDSTGAGFDLVDSLILFKCHVSPREHSIKNNKRGVSLHIAEILV